jgi:methionyl-tRNA formyltransferase
MCLTLFYKKSVANNSTAHPKKSENVMTAPLKIIFAGAPEFASEHLKALIDSEHEVVAVYTQPDRPAGRGRKLTPQPVKVVALEHDIPVYQPLTLKESEDQQFIKELNADVMVVVAYGLLLPQAVLDAPRLGCINVHGSILPRWRGAAPIQRAIEAGDRDVGVTIMQMDIGLDTGDMLSVVSQPNKGNMTSADLHDVLIEMGKPAMIDVLNKLSDGTAVAEKQDNEFKTYAHKMSKDEALIDWTQAVDIIQRKIMAFNPWPVCFTKLNGENFRIWKAQVASNETSHAAGEIVLADNKHLHIQCGDGVLALTNVQIPGSKAMDIKQVMSGKKQMFIDAGVLGEQDNQSGVN